MCFDNGNIELSEFYDDDCSQFVADIAKKRNFV